MFDLDMSELKLQLRRALDGQVRLWAGGLFVALALMAIEYDEIVAPEMSKISHAWGSAVTDLGRRLSVFSL